MSSFSPPPFIDSPFIASMTHWPSPPTTDITEEQAARIDAIRYAPKVYIGPPIPDGFIGLPHLTAEPPMPYDPLYASDNAFEKYPNYADVDISQPHIFGKMLHDAVVNGHPDVVEYLIEHYPISKSEKDFAFLIAVYENSIECMKVLYRHGADNLDDALSVASDGADLETVQQVINFGARDITRALAKARINDYPQIVQLLSFYQ